MAAAWSASLLALQVLLFSLYEYFFQLKAVFMLDELKCIVHDTTNSCFDSEIKFPVLSLITPSMVANAENALQQPMYITSRIVRKFFNIV